MVPTAQVKHDTHDTMTDKACIAGEKVGAGVEVRGGRVDLGKRMRHNRFHLRALL